MLSTKARRLCSYNRKASAPEALKGQITNYKPAVQITSISRKSDSKTILGQLGDIVRVVVSPFLALKPDRCTAESTTANFKHTLCKFSYIGDC